MVVFKDLGNFMIFMGLATVAGFEFEILNVIFFTSEGYLGFLVGGP